MNERRLEIPADWAVSFLSGRSLRAPPIEAKATAEYSGGSTCGDDAFSTEDRSSMGSADRARGRSFPLRRSSRRSPSLNAQVALEITEDSALDAQVQVREDRLDVAFMACSHESSTSIRA
ncbi:hypothetical protein [Chelativorans sp. YIM 93263]|uniref:hypothetical protein n=1 Tax=Chelativorans sp. YIM 93263 TaxID=2906648 RepID=UPI0023781EBA|nr:hypothetical protein [Chelativorans sp. YIM 93263]